MGSKSSSNLTYTIFSKHSNDKEAVAQKHNQSPAAAKKFLNHCANGWRRMHFSVTVKPDRVEMQGDGISMTVFLQPEKGE